MKIIVPSGGIGDEVALTPAVRELRRRRPSEKITLQGLKYASLWSNNPHAAGGTIDTGDVVTLDHGGRYMDAGSLPRKFARRPSSSTTRPRSSSPRPSVGTSTGSRTGRRPSPSTPGAATPRGVGAWTDSRRPSTASGSEDGASSTSASTTGPRSRATTRSSTASRSGPRPPRSRGAPSTSGTTPASSTSRPPSGRPRSGSSGASRPASAPTGRRSGSAP